MLNYVYQIMTTNNILVLFQAEVEGLRAKERIIEETIR